MSTFTVIAPTSGRPDALAALLRLLRPQIEGYAGRALIVVNPGAHDDACAAVVRPHLMWMRYVQTPAHESVGAPFNAGAARATGDILVFTHDAARPPADWLDRLEARHAADPALDGVAGATEPCLPTHPVMSARLIATAGALPGFRQDENGRLLSVSPTAFSIRRRWFAAMGGFDETFRLAGEGLDLTQRLIRAGAKLVADPAWCTGYAAPESLRACLARAYDEGEAAARCIYAHRDWGHPDVRAFFDDDDARRTVMARAKAAGFLPLAASAGPFDRLALRWFAWRLASSYAAGVLDGCDLYEDPQAPPPAELWQEGALAIEPAFAH